MIPPGVRRSSTWPPTAWRRRSTQVGALDQQAGVQPGRPLADHREHVVVLGLADHGGAALDNAGLLGGDRGRGVAQLGMVEADPVDDGHVPVDQVGGVQVPPMPTSTTWASTGSSENQTKASIVRAS